MSAILIEGDTENWFESGPVNDVLIAGNTFMDCAFNGTPEQAVIALNPSNTVIDARHPVHKNVRIIGNSFKLSPQNVMVYAKSTGGLVVRDNRVESTGPHDRQKPLVIKVGSK